MMATGQPGVPPAVASQWLELLFYGTCLAVALLVAALIIEVVRRWVRRRDLSPSASDQLAQYRALYKRGEISQEEFDRLRAVLGGEPVRAGKPPTPPPASKPPADGPPADGFRKE